MALKFTEVERHVLTKKAGVPHQNIHAWETGVCNPGKDYAKIIADWTGRDLVDVLYGVNPEDKGKDAANG